MFTGIIEEVGTVAVAGPSQLRINAAPVLDDAKAGASIAVNGVCLTAVHFDADGFWCDLSPRNAGPHQSRRAARRLARESGAAGRAWATGSSGHIVQGHVDGTAEFLSLEPLPDGNWWLERPHPDRSDSLCDPQGISHAGRRQPDRGFSRQRKRSASPSSRTPTKTPSSAPTQPDRASTSKWI